MKNLLQGFVLRERLRASVMLAGATLSLSAASLAWGGDGVRGNGKFVDVTRPAGAFRAVEVQSGIQVELRVGPAAIGVHAEENIAPLVETELRGDTLRVHFANHTSHSDSGVTVRVTAPQLERIEASGGAGVSGEVAKIEALEVEASGGAELHLKNLDARTVDAEGSGGATLELAGSAGALKLDVSGGTRFLLGKLAVKTAVIDASGGCEGGVQASESVRGEASGGSSLRVAGGAKVHVASSGGSSIDTE